MVAELGHTGNPLVLYIDDDASSRYLVSELIGGHTSYQIATAGSLSEGLQACDGVSPSLILLDMNLAQTSGHDVLQTIRHDPDLADLPVIALSGQVFKEDVDSAINAGFDGYVMKPINIKELIETLQRFLAQI